MPSKIVRISERNYENLKNCGRAGDSLNSTLDKIFSDKSITDKIYVVGASASKIAKDK